VLTRTTDRPLLLLLYVVRHGEHPPQDLTCAPLYGTLWGCPLRGLLSSLAVPHISLDFSPGTAAHTSIHGYCAAVPYHRVNPNVALHLRALLRVFLLHLCLRSFCVFTHPLFPSYAHPLCILTHPPFASLHTFLLRLRTSSLCPHKLLFCVLRTSSLRLTHLCVSMRIPRAVTRVQCQPLFPCFITLQN